MRRKIRRKARRKPARLWLRSVAGGPPLARMNAVDVCAGLVSGQRAPEAQVAEARLACRRQVVVAANGYVSPVIATTEVHLDEASRLIAAVVEASRRSGAVPAVLHCPAGDPLLRALPELGYALGVTDLYPSIDLPGSGIDDYLAALSRQRRTNVRREMRALAQGCGRIYAGQDAAAHIADAGVLVSAAYANRGQHIDVAEVVEIYTSLLAACGDDFVLCVVDVDGVPAASACLIVGGNDLLLPVELGAGPVGDRAAQLVPEHLRRTGIAQLRE